MALRPYLSEGLPILFTIVLIRFIKYYYMYIILNIIIIVKHVFCFFALFHIFCHYLQLNLYYITSTTPTPDRSTNSTCTKFITLIRSTSIPNNSWSNSCTLPVSRSALSISHTWQSVSRRIIAASVTTGRLLWKLSVWPILLYSSA